MEPENRHFQTRQPAGRFMYLSMIPAIVAASAAYSTTLFDFAAWAMFIGWVAFFIRPPSLRNGIVSLTCVWIGIAFGMMAALVLEILAPIFGNVTLAVVVFMVAMTVVSLRAVPLLNAVPAYFLGMITFFAAHLPPTLANYGELAVTTGIGTIAACVAMGLQSRILRQ